MGEPELGSSLSLTGDECDRAEPPQEAHDSFGGVAKDKAGVLDLGSLFALPCRVPQR